MNSIIAQDFIPYYPTQWDFRNQVDLIDFSQVKSLTTCKSSAKSGLI